jgi:hypothetical protein
MQVENADGRELSAEQWDGLVDWLKVRLGINDPYPRPAKNHTWRAAQLLRLDRVVSSRRLRPIWSRIQTDSTSEEWRASRLTDNLAALQRARLVFKMPNVTAWLPALLEHRPGVRLVHLIRHPAGMLSSWYARYTNLTVEAEHAAVNRERMARVLRVRPEWQALVGDLDTMTASVAELWYWRFCNETIRATLATHDNNLFLTDEELLADPVEIARRVTRHCQLTWSDAAERFVSDLAPHWQAHSSPWRSVTSPDDAKAVERVLDGSELQGLWSDDQVVSGHDYHAF